ncbi:MAG: hypothetical protein HWN66_19905, partial [Candidatus Helarchaeota archaeon]|nr:hypothetical protein [Candidatus Helarchaeota archaeon]
VSTSSYQDIISINGTYYYVIVAGNALGRSLISNCESVMVAIPPVFPFPPVLEPILPNPDYDGLLELNWSNVMGANIYYIYRANSSITSVSGMTPIATVSTSSYQDIISINGTYYYVIVAGNASGRSLISNCESVVVAIPAEPSPSGPPIWTILLTIEIICGIVLTGVIIKIIKTEEKAPAPVKKLTAKEAGAPAKKERMNYMN